MKKIKLAILIVIAMLAIEIHSQAISRNKLTNFPRITFDKTKHDFGKITQGGIEMYTFKYINSGNSQLIIKSIHADSPNCTILNDWKRSPINPNEESEFTIIYNSKNKKFRQLVTLLLTCNTEKEKEIVNFIVYVIPNKNTDTNETVVATEKLITSPTNNNKIFDIIQNETISNERELMDEAHDRMVVEIEIDEASRIEKEALRRIEIELDIIKQNEKRMKRE
ncbi:MAG TPA: DUF1573 domain-containing protein [Lutibacter sp.]|nr:DUF1573 domain-containing protein [Lutibacter sp.]